MSRSKKINAPQSQNSEIDRAERFRPWLLAAVMALFTACPLLPTESSGREGEMLPPVMLTLLLAATWAAAQIGRRRISIRFQAVDVAVLALVALHSIAALLAAWQGHARPAVNVLWLWIGMCLSYFLLRQLLATWREARAAAVVMIGLAVLLAADGLWQYAYEFPAMRAAYAKNPDEMLRSQDMWYPPGSPERAQFDNRLASREPLATFALTNSLAGYLAPWLVFSVGIALATGRLSQRAVRLRLAAAAACAILIAACLVLTKSRSGYIAAVLGLLLVFFFTQGWRKRLPWKPLAVGVLVVALLVGAALAVGGLDVEVFSEAAKSLGYRRQYWRSTAEMIAAHPLFGCGPGQFQNAYTCYKLPEASEEIAEPHNFLLEVWATAGTPAALALLAVPACFAWSFTKRNRIAADADNNKSEESNDKDATAWVFGGGLAGLLVAWPLGLMASIPPNGAVYFFAAPLAIAAVFFLHTWIKEPTSVQTLPVLAAIAIAVMLINLSAAGGIGFAGVAGSFWLLLALGLFRESGGKCRTFDSLAAPVLTAFLAVLAAACYVSAYRPVLNAESHYQAALNDPAQAEEHLLAATLADPFSAQAPRQLALLCFDKWKTSSNPRDLELFEQYMAAALTLDAGSSSAWQLSADRYLEIYERTKMPAHLEQAVNGLRKAIELYPHDATARAKYALALRIADRPQEAEKQAKTAIELDSLTPHADKKIPKSLRQRLIETGD